MLKCILLSMAFSFSINLSAQVFKIEEYDVCSYGLSGVRDIDWHGDELIFSTFNEGIGKIVDGELIMFFDSLNVQGLADNSVSHIEVVDSKLYCLHENFGSTSLYVYNLNSDKLEKLIDSYDIELNWQFTDVANAYPYAIVAFENGKVACGLSSGIVLFDGTGFKQITDVDNDGVTDVIWDVEKLNSDEVIFSFSNFIYKYNFKEDSLEEIISTSPLLQIGSILPFKGEIYFVSDNKLYKTEGSTFIEVELENELIQVTEMAQKGDSLLISSRDIIILHNDIEVGKIGVGGVRWDIDVEDKIAVSANHGIRIISSKNLTSTSNLEKSLNEISVYPNPVLNQITVEKNSGFRDLKPIQLFNEIGEEIGITSLIINDRELTIDVSNIGYGLFLLSVDGKIFKFVR